MSTFSRDLLKWQTFLGTMVTYKQVEEREKKGEETFMQKIACMHPEWREIVAYLEILKMLEENPKAKQDIDQIILICQKIGQALWMPDIITHLAMKSGPMTELHEAYAAE